MTRSPPLAKTWMGQDPPPILARLNRYAKRTFKREMVLLMSI